MRSAARPAPAGEARGEARGDAHLDGGHRSGDTHGCNAPVNTLPTANSVATPIKVAPSADLTPGQDALDTHTGRAGGTLQATTRDATPIEPPSPATHDALLLILADALDDLERTRIANENRLRSLEQIKGQVDSREADTMRDIADALSALEHRAELALKRAMRAHPLGPWVKRTIGIGEKQGARLLAAIGDPADRAMPSQLWQYCGHGAPSRRARGVKTFWNPTAKMRLHLIAESCMKQRTSPYRAVYDDARMDWAARDTSDGHKHSHALRMVGKAILLDLWREAKDAG